MFNPMDSFNSMASGVSMPSGINLGFIFIALIILAIGIMANINAKKKREADALMYMIDQAKEENVPIIVPVDLSGYCDPYIGLVDDKAQDVMFNGKKISLHIRPSLLDKCTPMYIMNTRWYFYFGNMYYPQNLRNMWTLVELVDVFREYVPEANFITDDLNIVNLMTTDDGEALKFNCGAAIKEFKQFDYMMDESGNPIPQTEQVEVVDNLGNVVIDDNTGEPLYTDEIVTDEDGNTVYIENDDKIDQNQLYDMVRHAREYIHQQPVRAGLLDFKSALNLIPISLDALHLQRIMKIVEQKKEEELQKEEAPYMKYLPFLVAVMIAGAIAYVIISKAGA